MAEDNGFFREESLDYEFELQGYAGASWTTASVQPGDAAPLSARSGALEDMEKGRSCSVSGACHWAVKRRRFVDAREDVGQDVLGLRLGLFAAPDSPYHRPEDLANVKVGVGHSGSHYSAIQALEWFLERSEIALEFVGLPFDRVRLMQQGKIEAANVFGAQDYLLEQFGFRKLVDMRVRRRGRAGAHGCSAWKEERTRCGQDPRRGTFARHGEPAAEKATTPVEADLAVGVFPPGRWRPGRQRRYSRTTQAAAKCGQRWYRDSVRGVIVDCHVAR